MTILIDSEEAFDKIQHFLTVKELNKLRIEGIYLKIISVIYDRPVASNILNGKIHESIY